MFIDPPETDYTGLYTHEENRQSHAETYFRKMIGDREYLGISYIWMNKDETLGRFFTVVPKDKLDKTSINALSLISFNRHAIVVPAILPVEFNPGDPFFDDINYYQKYWKPNEQEISNLINAMKNDPTKRNITSDFSKFFFYAAFAKVN